MCTNFPWTGWEVSLPCTSSWRRGCVPISTCAATSSLCCFVARQSEDTLGTQPVSLRPLVALEKHSVVKVCFTWAFLFNFVYVFLQRCKPVWPHCIISWLIQLIDWLIDCFKKIQNYYQLWKIWWKYMNEHTLVQLSFAVIYTVRLNTIIEREVQSYDQIKHGNFPYTYPGTSWMWNTMWFTLWETIIGSPSKNRGQNFIFFSSSEFVFW